MACDKMGVSRSEETSSTDSVGDPTQLVAPEDKLQP
jgi:hypothetical protein